MNLRELTHTLQEEIELLGLAIDEVSALLGQKLDVLVVAELEPITAYAASLRARIRALEHGIDYTEHKRESCLSRLSSLMKRTNIRGEE